MSFNYELGRRQKKMVIFDRDAEHWTLLGDVVDMKYYPVKFIQSLPILVHRDRLRNLPIAPTTKKVVRAVVDRELVDKDSECTIKSYFANLWSNPNLPKLIIEDGTIYTAEAWLDEQVALSKDAAAG